MLLQINQVYRFATRLQKKAAFLIGRRQRVVLSERVTAVFMGSKLTIKFRAFLATWFIFLFLLFLFFPPFSFTSFPPFFLILLHSFISLHLYFAYQFFSSPLEIQTIRHFHDFFLSCTFKLFMYHFSMTCFESKKKYNNWNDQSNNLIDTVGLKNSQQCCHQSRWSNNIGHCLDRMSNWSIWIALKTIHS